MSIHVIGTITNIIPTDDPENPTVITLDGWHVNSTEVLPECDEYLLKGDGIPAVPYNLFAGVPAEDTFFYVFPDETAAQEFGIGVIDAESETLRAELRELIP